MNNNSRELNKLKKAIKIALVDSKSVICKISKDKTEYLIKLSSIYPIIDINVVEEYKNFDMVSIKPNIKLMCYQKEMIKGWLGW